MEKAGKAQRALDVIREVYAAFKSLDPSVIEEMCTTHYAPDVVLREAQSLPWGGVYNGLVAVRDLTLGICNPQNPIDASKLEVLELFHGANEAREVEHVVAAVSFPWKVGDSEPVLMRAMEWFTLNKELKVIELQVFMWDTAACLASLQSLNIK